MAAKGRRVWEGIVAQGVDDSNHLPLRAAAAPLRFEPSRYLFPAVAITSKPPSLRVANNVSSVAVRYLFPAVPITSKPPPL
jgi:hypothetical protein